VDGSTSGWRGNGTSETGIFVDGFCMTGCFGHFDWIEPSLVGGGWTEVCRRSERGSTDVRVGGCYISE